MFHSQYYRDGRPGTMREHPNLLAILARIERVAQSIAEEGEREGD